MLINILVSLDSTICYIGPGLGGGIIAAVLGILASFFLALFAILWYPFKRLYQKIKKKKNIIEHD